MNDGAIEADAEAVDEVFVIADGCVGGRWKSIESDLDLLMEVFVAIEFPGEVVSAAAGEEGDGKFCIGILVDKEIQGTIAADEPDVGE